MKTEELKKQLIWLIESIDDPEVIAYLILKALKALKAQK